jgi:glutamate-1-semialdehyde 2,1-aminomutase
LLKEVLEEFKKKTPTSRKIYEKALSLLPGGISHNVRTWNLPSIEAYPIHIKAAKGCCIWDVDDNEYVDNWMGHMEAILGHNPEQIVNALTEQLTQVGGAHWGIVNEKQVELAKHVVDIVPSIEMVRFCCSGTEATMYAVRLARGFTEKKTIIKALGGWHGYNTLLNWYHFEPFEETYESMGQIPEVGNYVKGVPFGDIKETLRMIKENKDDLAAVIFEIKMTQIHERDHAKITAYLKEVKEEVENIGSLLIIDEVITGFRLALGGAQEYFGVNADLSTYGKILGGGMHLGALGGRKEIMQLANPLEWQAGRKKKSDMVWIGGGTFSANPLSMTAGIETLKILKKNKQIYEKIDENGRHIRSNFKKIFEDAGLPFDILGIQSSFNPDLQSLNHKQRMEWVLRLLNNGVYGHRPEGYLSAVHEKPDIEKNIDAFDLIVNNMKKQIKI